VWDSSVLTINPGYHGLPEESIGLIDLPTFTFEGVDPGDGNSFSIPSKTSVEEERFLETKITQWP